VISAGSGANTGSSPSALATAGRMSHLVLVLVVANCAL
jgi:hypothetical protein